MMDWQEVEVKDLGLSHYEKLAGEGKIIIAGKRYCLPSGRIVTHLVLEKKENKLEITFTNSKKVGNFSEGNKLFFKIPQPPTAYVFLPDYDLQNFNLEQVKPIWTSGND